jgi:hypothetical protein
VSLLPRSFADIDGETALERASFLPCGNRISPAVARAPELGDDRPFHPPI